jgi:hypothetical protein
VSTLRDKARELVVAIDALRYGVHDCGGAVEITVRPAEWYAVDLLAVELEEEIERTAVETVPRP